MKAPQFVASGLVLATFLIGNAFAQTQENPKGATPIDLPITALSKVDAKAACDTIFLKIQEARKANGEMISDEQSQKMLNLCDAGVEELYEKVRQEGSESFIGGISVFVGAEINIPARFKTLSGGARAAGGASAFITTDPNGPGLRFTSTVNVTPLDLNAGKGTPNIVEPQYGIAAYIGNSKIKSTRQLSGMYGVLGMEFSSPFSSELNGKKAFTLLGGRNAAGAKAIFLLSSFNGGINNAAAHAQAIYVNNYSRTGAGMSIGGIMSATGQAIVEAKDDLVNVVMSMFRE